jgi:hypothetical protein
MAISGLVITLSENESAAHAALMSLESDPRLTMGECFGHRVAIVAETSSPDADQALWEALRSHPGIVNVDVAFVEVDAGTQHAEPAASTSALCAESIGLENPHANP